MSPASPHGLHRGVRQHFSTPSGQRLTGAGQIFRVAMYHENHPDGSYEMANLVVAFEAPRAISWKPGYVSPETGKLEFGGWIWGYDLTQLGPAETKVTLSYDWSAVGPIPASTFSSRRFLQIISTTR